MAINTPYLSADTASGGMNTPYILTGSTGISSDLSSTGTIFCNNLIIRSGGTEAGNLVVSGTLAVTGATTLGGALNSASAASFGAITGTTGTLTSTLTVGGKITATSVVSAQNGLDVSQTTQAKFLSYQTTASATSLILPDGGFGMYFLSTTSAALAFRSGATTYTIRVTAASVL